MPDLDDRIRSLVASAVADAPAAPDIDALPVPATAPRRPNWFMRGGVALAALLAGIGGVTVLQPADQSDVDTGRDTTTIPATPQPARPEPSVLITAGPDGVVEHVDGRTRVVTNEPMAMALALDNGDVVAQRRRDPDARPSGVAEVPLLITTDGTMTPIFDPKTVKGPVDLHDFAIVDGRRLVLYSVYEPDPGPPDAVPGWDELLFTFDLDSGAITPLGTVGGWEHTHSRLHLGANGLIIGTEQGIAGNGLLAKVIPGSPAASRPLPSQTDLGYPPADEDCECPTFVLDAAGSTLYWAAAGGRVMAAAVDDLAEPRQVATVPVYDGLVLDVADDGVVVSYLDFEYKANHNPVLVRNGAVTNLPGSVATVGHDG